MSIATRIESMYDNVDKAYKSINKLGVDLTDVDKNIENISPLLDDFYDTLPKVTGTGETLTLNNTSEAPMEIDLKGNTSQASEPTPSTPVDVNVVSGDNTIEVVGKNLANYDNNNNLEYRFLNASGEFETSTYTYINGIIKTNSNKMTVSFKNKTGTGNIRIGHFKSDGTFIKRDLLSSTPTTITLDNDVSYLIYSIDKRESTNFEEVQIQTGDSATSYQPYTSQTQLISLGVENLFDKSNWQKYAFDITIGTSTYNDHATANKVANGTPIKVEGGKYYVLNWTNPSGVTINEFNLYCYDSSGILRYVHASSGNSLAKGVARKLENDVAYINISSFGSLTDEQLQGIANTLQLTKGTMPQHISNNPIELCKIGDKQDYIYKDNGTWYLHKEIGKVTYVGTESNWYKQDSWSAVGSNTSAFYRAKPSDSLGDTNTYSNYFVRNTNITSVDTPCMNLGGTNIIFRINKTLADTTDGFKTWLGNNNVEARYILATPTNTEITDTTLINQLDNLQNLNSYNPTTNIMQENNDKPFIITASALKDLSNL